MRSALLGLFGVFALACGDDSASATSDTGTSTAADVTTDSGTTDSGVPGSTSTDSSSGGATTQGTTDSVIQKIVAGGVHTCALLEDGIVRCWGDGLVGSHGQGHGEDIGDDELAGAGLPVDIGGPARDLAAGEYHTCALLEGGDVVCWGGNTYGQLGYGNQEHIGNDEAPADVGPVPIGVPAIRLALGIAHTCVLASDGSVHCWGDGSYAQGGHGLVGVGHDAPITGRTEVDVGEGTVVEVACGGYHTCVRFEDGSMRCWGRGNEGQLGTGSMDDTRDTPVAELPLVQLDEPATAIGLGGLFSCALTEGGVYCWGGLPNLDNVPSPQGLPPVDLGPGIPIQVVGGSQHACVLLDDGSVRCWGAGDRGVLGYGNTEEIGDDEAPGDAGPVDVGAITTQLSAETVSTCVRTDSARARCWGSGSSGRLGYGTTDDIGDDETPSTVGDIPL